MTEPEAVHLLQAVIPSPAAPDIGSAGIDYTIFLQAKEMERFYLFRSFG